jgi:Flp pilus assembly protein TadD
MLALVGLASFAVAAGYSNRSEAHTVPSPSAIAKAREAMMRGDHTDALGYYKKIPNATPDELFHMAECQFRTNDYEAALETCCRIDFDTGGTSWSAPLVRGWIAERRGHKILAVTWYTQSAERGNPGAKKLAERVK